jgi:glycosyltransferase involved in cell wall biosynthesis
LLKRLKRSLKLLISVYPQLAWLLIASTGFIKNIIATRWLVHKNCDSCLSFKEERQSVGKKITHNNRILFIEQSIPRIDRNAGAITIDQFMELFLNAGWNLTLWPQDRCYDTHYGYLLKKKGVEILSSDRWLGDFKTWWHANAKLYSVVLISRPAVCAAFLPILRKYGNPRVLYYGHDLHFARIQSEAELTDIPELYWLSKRFRRIESWIWENTDCSYYPSVEEADTARAICPKANIRSVIPYFFDTIPARSHCPPKNHKILFVGNFHHPPNVDAVDWLIQEILPSIRSQCAKAELLIVGSGITQELKTRWNQELGIKLRGWLSEEALTTEYESCRVVVAPLRFGAGVKHKVVAALAKGRPVVMTNIGAQGMEWLNGSADIVPNCSEFVAATINLLTNDAYWSLRATTGLQTVRTRFTASAMSSAFDELNSSSVEYQ